MKIVEISTYLVYNYRANWVFVEMKTDDGITGVGEATLEMKERTVCTAIEELREYLVGKDPRDIERHVHRMYRDSYWRVGPVLMSAISGVEMCMWDILGKSLGVPVYRLIGGKSNESVRGYANGWFAGSSTPSEFGEAAARAVGRGFTALKWDPFGKSYLTIDRKSLDTALACIDAVRNSVGSDVDLLIEGHGRFDTRTALEIAKEIEPFKPMFFEEPVPPDDMGALIEVGRKSPVAISAGERLYSTHQFRDLLEARAVRVVQPDVSHAGGISGLKKIAAMAEAYTTSFAPHNPSGPIANAATLHVALATPNFLIHEIMATDIPWRSIVCDESISFEDGKFSIPDTPGLGVTLNTATLADYPYEPRPLRHYRGTLTDIRPVDAVPYF